MDGPEILRHVETLAELEKEIEWAEFKCNNENPDEIGEYISALANGAAYCRRPRAYIVWGVDDATHVLLGTTARLHTRKVNGQELENWLTLHLRPAVNFRFHEAERDGLRFCLLEIAAASVAPVRFKDTAYIRVGSYKKKLKDHPDREKALWELLTGKTFESEAAQSGLPIDEAIGLLDYAKYFELTEADVPDRHLVIERFVAEEFLRKEDDGRYSITNLGAILFAKDLGHFGPLGRKVIRVVFYDGGDRTAKTRELEGLTQGYGKSFEDALARIRAGLPENEHIEEAFREKVVLYPPIAIRELLANALIHQEFTIGGAGPLVEIFSDRIEITNPGEPLVELVRLIDSPPRSRNEKLASFMRRAKVCEELGSGIDKVISAVEVFQSPAPDFSVIAHNMRVTLYAPRAFRNMSSKERVRACYQHASLLQVANREMTNATLRKRFGIEEENKAQASRVISDTLEQKLIKPYDPENKAPRHARYVPFWA